MSHLGKSVWHKKARWLIKNLVIKPPTNTNQMRNLCSNIIARRPSRHPHVDTQTAFTKNIVGTALALWEDKNLVDALNKNQTFLNAKERIQRTAKHLLAPVTDNSNERGNFSQETDNNNVNNNINNNFGPRLMTASTTPTSTTTTVLQAQCPACGRSALQNHIELHKMDDDGKNCVSTQENESRFASGSVGNLPPNYEWSKEDDTTQFKGLNSQDDLAPWFGPLVITALAIVGLAVAVFNGELTLSRTKNRTVAAVNIILQASNGILKLFGFMN